LNDVEQGKGKGKGKGKSSKSSESEKAASVVDGDNRKTEMVKMKALDVFAGCGGIGLLLCWHHLIMSLIIIVAAM